MMRKQFYILALPFLLPACAVGPDYTAPQDSFFDGWFSGTAAGDQQAAIKTDWWTIFNDPLLENYIAQAARNNKDLQVALANVRQARALHREAAAAFLPSIDGNAQADRAKSSDAASTTGNGTIRNMYDAGFDASWEIDIFGGTRRAREASSARVGSAVADYQAVMLSTLSEVARTYYEARGLQKRMAITQNNADLLNQTLELVEARIEAGEASAFDSARARSEYDLMNARLPNLQADLQSSIYRLSVLLGQPPEALLAEMQAIAPLPVPPDVVPVGLRSELLRRRPDIRMAERELAASVADIGVETAELFPKFFLTGDIGSQARAFGDLFSAAGGLWSFGSLLQWSVFDGGATQARINAAEAESEAALARYEKSVLEALADAESALVQYGQELETRRRTESGVQSRREAAQLARELYRSGETDFLAVLDAERELAAGEDSLVLSETQSVAKLIALYTALGGGWEKFAMPE